LRGRATAQCTSVNLLAAFSATLRCVIGQLQVASEANEITAEFKLLKRLSLDGVIINGDAIFTQSEVCHVITVGGGHYFFTVKDNQPELKANIAPAFWPDSSLSGMVAAA
jgi:predicted transposase YbfD/YdcC